MSLNHGISMVYTPLTPFVFTRWEHEYAIHACLSSGNFRWKETAENSEMAERGVFLKKAEGYKSRTWLGSRPGLTLLFLHSKITFLKPAC